jgi:hypothetical protein
MRAAYYVETGEEYPVKVESLRIASGYDMSVTVADLYAAGSSAVKRKDLNEAQAALSKMRKVGGASSGSETAAHCDAGGPGASPSDFVAVEVMQKELEAEISMAKGNKEDAIAMIKQATELEERMNFGFGPPIPVKPSYELLGEMLMQTGRYGEAKTAFEKSLARSPRRIQSEKGLAKALSPQSSQSGSPAANRKN